VSDELQTILEESGLGEYADLFEKQKITDIDILLELTEAELEQIGVKAIGDRKRILKLSDRRHVRHTPADNSGSESADSPREVVVHHAVQSGQDAQAGFGRGFGETIGEKTGGCLWTLGIFVLVIMFIGILAAVKGCPVY
jgi:preprotein translocase subunit SecF